MDESTYTIENILTPASTLSQLREAIAAACNVPPAQQRLEFSGRSLTASYDDGQLESLGIVSGSCVVVFRDRVGEQFREQAPTAAENVNTQAETVLQWNLKLCASCAINFLYLLILFFATGAQDTFLPMFKAECFTCMYGASVARLGADFIASGNLLLVRIYLIILLIFGLYVVGLAVKWAMDTTPLVPYLVPFFAIVAPCWFMCLIRTVQYYRALGRPAQVEGIPSAV